MPLLFWRNIIFATSATTVVALVLILIAFQVQKLQLLVRTIAKLDELLELLGDEARALADRVEAAPARARRNPGAVVARQLV